MFLSKEYSFQSHILETRLIRNPNIGFNFLSERDEFQKKLEIFKPFNHHGMNI